MKLHHLHFVRFDFLKIFSSFRTMCNNAGRFARLVVTRQKLPAAKANYWPYNMFTPQFWQGRGKLRARWSTCIGCLHFCEEWYQMSENMWFYVVCHMYVLMIPIVIPHLSCLFWDKLKFFLEDNLISRSKLVKYIYMP